MLELLLQNDMVPPKVSCYIAPTSDCCNYYSSKGGSQVRKYEEGQS